MSAGVQKGLAREGGFALLIVLWSVVLLALLATGITASGRTDVQLASNLRGAAQAEAAADGAVFEAVFHLLDPGSEAGRWRADGVARDHAVQGATATVRIDDEAGKVNPNTASPELLRALLRAVGADAQTAAKLADAIADWRFPGAEPRLNGAKAGRYRAAGLAYGPPGAPFESVGELSAVLGMTPALLASLMPSISLFNDAEPLAQRAPAPVLQALRETGGAQPPDPRGPPPLRAVTITAEAVTPTGARFTRRAAVRLGAAAKEPLFAVLTWEAAAR